MSVFLLKLSSLQKMLPLRLLHGLSPCFQRIVNAEKMNKTALQTEHNSAVLL